MTIDPWDFTTIVAVPYLAVAILMLRRFLRTDGSGNRNQQSDALAPVFLALAGAAIAVPLIFIVLRMAHVFIPYGSVWLGGAGLAWLVWAILLQRRPKPPPVQSKERRPSDQKIAADAGERRPQRFTARRPF